MTFNSLSYAFFLPLIYLLFCHTTDSLRWLVLLVASYGFYASFMAPQLLLALALVSEISYTCAIRLSATSDEIKRKQILWTGIFACVMFLAIIKYLLPQVISLEPGSPYASLILSTGISFFTFQAISYMADVYLDILTPEKHRGYHALFLAFFPKLLQGPIERGGDLLPQLRRAYQPDFDDFRSGISLFTWGLFKKVVISNHLALYVNSVYGNVHGHYNVGLPLLVATYFYALQIFFDFSGYTDMARGTARLFGVDLTENFNNPYGATSIADFWRRWHISFSRWILDYIFNPLQMAWRYHKKAGVAMALIITFLVSGVWHGASGGFVVWGLLHGVFLATSVYYKPYQKRLHKWLGLDKSNFLKIWQTFVTFNMVSFTWIFFRAKTIDDALFVIKSICFDITFTVNHFYTAVIPFTKDNSSISHCMVMVMLLVFYVKLENYSKAYMPAAVFSLLVVLIVFLGKLNNSSFIYLGF